jgi:hypothetical protein
MAAAGRHDRHGVPNRPGFDDLNMPRAKQRIAVYTTIYPGVEAYLPDWYRSVQEQTDQDFQLWIGLDGIEASAVGTAVGSHLDVVWVPSEPGNTPARIRQLSLARIVEDFDAVVLVDSDDILHPSRVAAARAALQTSELAACALRLVDQERRDLGTNLTLPDRAVPDTILPRNNVFGFSNSAYRSELLRRCLPIPAGIALVDWFLATKAWLMGARLAFDPVVRMDYRQHGTNMAPIRFPFDANQVIRDTKKVREHFCLLQASRMENVLPDRWAQVQEAAADVQLFSEQVASQPKKLEDYVLNLNTLEPAVVWWWGVAQPALQWMWKNHAGVPYAVSKN